MKINHNTDELVSDMADGIKFLEPLESGVTIFGSARTKHDDPYYLATVELAGKIAEGGLPVYTGGGDGIMGAANKGAFEAGGKSYGLNIVLPHEQALNPYTTANHTFDYFYSRKFCLVHAAKAVVCMPGGFGTLDELSDVLDLIKTDKLPKIPVILFDRKFWTPFHEMVKDAFEAYHMIDEHDEDIYNIVDTVEEALEIIFKKGA
ncbi:MAG: TIGR00730 family Rossman fold protein [Lactobacillales bacterium]|jgi:uncharacterized protein (TIGR00730 family)|nr:TIGR00730 family Rossman fold protein [Lactobacillales bacterium]